MSAHALDALLTGLPDGETVEVGRSVTGRGLVRRVRWGVRVTRVGSGYAAPQVYAGVVPLWVAVERLDSVLAARGSSRAVAL